MSVSSRAICHVRPAFVFITSKLSSKKKSEPAFLVCMAAAASSSPAASSDAAECSLLGGPFAICVQIGLAAAAIATVAGGN